MRKKAPHKSIISYFLPFFLLGILISFVIYYSKTFSNISFSASVPASLEIIETPVKVLLKNKETWHDVPQNISGVKLFYGDFIKTLNNGKAKLQLLQESFVYIDENTSINIEKLEEDDALRQSVLQYQYGKILLSIKRILNPKSYFYIQKEDFRIYSRGGIFIINEENLQVLEGKVKVEFLQDNNLINTIELGVGQEIMLYVDDNGTFSDIKPLNSEVYTQEFVQMALQTNTIKEFSAPINPLIPTIEKDTESTSVIETEKVPDSLENTNTIDSIDSKEYLIKIISPQTKDEKTITITKEPLEIKGTTSAGAEKIQVNNYTLQQFKKNDTQWYYKAQESFKNLKKGNNTYTIEVTFLDGKTVSETLEVIYEPEEKKTEETETETEKEKTVEDTSSATVETTKEDVKTTETSEVIKDTPKVITEEVKESLTDTSEVSSDGILLAVTTPQENEKINTDPVIIQGTAPLNTAKITVGDYTLQTFKLGDRDWKYVASQQYGNLEIGKENKHLIRAYDINDKEISSIQFIFFSSFIKE
jgi:hypothetical protein